MSSTIIQQSGELRKHSRRYGESYFGGIWQETETISGAASV